MFDVGFWELALIGVIALIILGPERLPKAARTAGFWMGKARRMLREVKADIDKEIRASELAELKKVGEDVGEAGKGIKEATRKIGADLDDGTVRDAISDMKPEKLDPDGSSGTAKTT